MSLLNLIYHHCSHVQIDPKTIKGIIVLLNTFFVGSVIYGIWEFIKNKIPKFLFWETIFDSDRPIILYLQVATIFIDVICIILSLGKLVGSWL